MFKLFLVFFDQHVFFQLEDSQKETVLEHFNNFLEEGFNGNISDDALKSMKPPVTSTDAYANNSMNSRKKIDESLKYKESGQYNLDAATISNGTRINNKKTKDNEKIIDSMVLYFTISIFSYYRKFFLQNGATDIIVQSRMLESPYESESTRNETSVELLPKKITRGMDTSKSSDGKTTDMTEPTVSHFDDSKI